MRKPRIFAAVLAFCIIFASTGVGYVTPPKRTIQQRNAAKSTPARSAGFEGVCRGGAGGTS